MSALRLKSGSANQTKRIGREIGKHLKGGDTVLLRGELGAGKTTLVRGIARGLGIPPKELVTSPTFTILQEYEGSLKLFHFDWYRLSSVEGGDEETFLECLQMKDAVCVVEWPERGRVLCPKTALRIRLEHQSPTQRVLHVSGPKKVNQEIFLSLRRKFK